jgi:hypothetical protein
VHRNHPMITGKISPNPEGILIVVDMWNDKVMFGLKAAIGI